jgi:UDP-N-acetylglucosamine acyltransferase
MVDGNPARVRGLNLEGLKRSGVSRDDIQALKEAYRLVYRSDLNRTQAVEEIRTQGLEDYSSCAEFVRFLLESERGRRGRGREAFRTDLPQRPGQGGAQDDDSDGQS